MEKLKEQIINELAGVFYSIEHGLEDSLANGIADAERVFVYGVGRERLMLQAFAMRLMHLGIKVFVVGDVTTPPIQRNDLFITSSGTGYLSTVEALLRIAKEVKARVVFMTAHPEAPLPRLADLVIKIPAQTMKDCIDNPTSIQPMGSLFEQAQMLFLEMVVIRLKDMLGQSEADMKKRHTNLE